MLHRLREACEDDSTYNQFSGVVEVDETYLGGKFTNKDHKKEKPKGRGPVGKQPVMGIRQRNGRVSIFPLRSLSGRVMLDEVWFRVANKATVYTDEHRSYTGLRQWFTHAKVNHGAKQWTDGDVHTNTIESVWAVFKRGYHGTYHHWNPKHTIRYGKEFAFRLNQRTLPEAMNGMVDGAIGKRLTYEDLISA